MINAVKSEINFYKKHCPPGVIFYTGMQKRLDTEFAELEQKAVVEIALQAELSPVQDESSKRIG